MAKVEFLISAVDLKGCPRTTVPEFAFFGRSNVGKSTLINLLTGVKNLAKTSATPGKTRLINFFSVNSEWLLVDLPGYGYARVAQQQRRDWETTLKNYLARRETLLCTFILVDIRHEPLTSDLELMRWMGENGLPFAIVFTKADKLSRSRQQANVAQYSRILLKEWEELPPLFVTSSLAGDGKEAVLGFIRQSVQECALGSKQQ